MIYGAWTLAATRGFMPGELADAIAEVSTDIEIRYIGGLSRATAGFVDAARLPSWVHITFWDPDKTGLVLTFERDAKSPDGPFTLKVEAELATDRVADEPSRRAIIGELAERVIAKVCERLGMSVASFDLAGGA